MRKGHPSSTVARLAHLAHDGPLSLAELNNRTPWRTNSLGGLVERGLVVEETQPLPPRPATPNTAYRVTVCQNTVYRITLKGRADLAMALMQPRCPVCDHLLRSGHETDTIEVHAALARWGVENGMRLVNPFGTEFHSDCAKAIARHISRAIMGPQLDARVTA